MKKTRVLVFMSMLIALNVLLTHVIPVIQTDIVRISFGFIPLSLGSMLFGPVIGGIGGALSDILGMIIAPKGAYLPGFTLNAFLRGVIYGMFLYKKPKNPIRVTLAVLCISIFVNLLINTYWLTFLYKDGYLVMLADRLLQNALMSVVQIIMIPLIWKYVGKSVDNVYLQQPS